MLSFSYWPNIGDGASAFELGLLEPALSKGIGSIAAVVSRVDFLRITAPWESVDAFAENMRNPLASGSESLQRLLRRFYFNFCLLSMFELE